MKGPYRAIKVTEKIYWVGAIDWDLRDFHGYATSRGSTYNAFLIVDEKITLIDTVKAPFKKELLSRISSIIDPTEIDYIVSNHAEMDHSGCLEEIIDIVKPEKVFASLMGVKALEAHFHKNLQIEAVKDGQIISLGKQSLQFFETRMLHWPDSMITYCPEEKILFSQDGFGMHLAGYERMSDDCEEWILKHEAAKYFANILTPYAPLIGKLMEKIEKAGLKIDIIAPDHGPIWKNNRGKILEWYGEWAQQKPGNKAVVIYDTMWNSSQEMSRAVAEGLAFGGTQVQLLPLKGSTRSDIATELLDAGAIVYGAPTLNNNVYPTIADTHTYIKGLKFKNLKVSGAVTSYGWSGESAKHLEDMLKEINTEFVGLVKVNYVPTEEVLNNCFDLGVKIANRLKEVK